MYEYYTLKNGMTLTNEDDISLFEKLLSLRPHQSVSFLWNDIGLGNLFAECFSSTERFCVDNQKWYIYSNGVSPRKTGTSKKRQNKKHLKNRCKLEIEPY